MQPHVDDKDRFLAEYREIGYFIRHFSTVRSALTTFLISVGLGAFGVYHREGEWAFLIAAGHLFVGVAVVACMVFSYRTERHVVHFKKLWNWAKSETSDYPKIDDVTFFEVLKGMASDAMNYVLMCVVVAVVGGFWLLKTISPENFPLAVIIVLSLITAVASTLIFFLCVQKNRFWPAVVAAAVLTLVPLAAMYFLLGRDSV